MTTITNTTEDRSLRERIATSAPGEIIRATQEELNALRPDPAPSGLQLAEKQIFSLLDNMTDDPIKELRELRDEIDDTIRTYQSNQKALAGLLTHHREIGESAKAIKPIAAEAMRELQDRLRSQTVAVNKLVNGRQDQ